MGIVYEAYDEELDRTVAIKVHRESETMRDRIRVEALALASLSHPNVVPIYDAGSSGEYTYLVMERLHGTTLDRWCRATSRTTHELGSTLTGVARGLVAIHEAGLVHRDIKPSNVIVTGDRRVLIVDFGLAISDADARVAAQPVAGTPNYIAPEQRAGGKCTPRSDQYSYCSTAMRCFAGHPSSRATKRLRRVLERGLREDPRDRYASMAELLFAIQVAMKPARSRRRLVAALLGVGVVVVAAGSGGEADPCGASEERWYGVWDVARRTALHDAFAELDATWAPSAQSRIVAGLDHYVEGWNARYESTCADGFASFDADERRQCLRDGQAAVRLLVNTLIDVGPGEAHAAAHALESLPDLSSCTRPSSEPFWSIRSAEAQAIHSRRIEADAWRRTNQLDRALVAADALVPRAERLDDSLAIASVRRLRGEILADQGRYQAARAELLRALDVAAPAGHANEAAEILNELVMLVGHQIGQPEEALVLARHAESWIRRAGDDPRLHARRLLAQSWAALDLADSESATDELERALKMLEASEADGTDVLDDRVAILNALGIAVGRSGRSKQALAHFSEAERLITEHLGSEHPDLASPRINRAQVLREMRDYAGSIDQLELARGLLDSSDGAPHPLLGAVEANLAVTEIVRGRGEQALGHANRAIALLSEARGPEHRSLIRTRAIRAEARLRMGDIDAALADYEATQRAMEMRFGDDHPMVADARVQTARALFRAGRHDEARGHYEQALRTLSKARGQEHPSLADPLVFLGQLDMIDGDPGAAVLKLARAAHVANGNLAGYCHLRYGQALLVQGDVNLARFELELAGELGVGRPDGPLEAERRASLAEAEAAQPQ